MPSGHRALAILWGVILALVMLGCVLASPPLIVLPIFGAMPAAYLTYRHVDRTAQLAHRGWYYALVGSLLLSAAGTAVGSGMTVFITGTGALPILGFLALGTTNVAVAILAWRALVTPSTRIAALAGMLAVLLEMVAMSVDVMLDMHKGGFNSERELGMAIALFGALISVGTGALASLAALITFVPQQVAVPEARVVDNP